MMFFVWFLFVFLYCRFYQRCVVLCYISLSVLSILPLKLQSKIVFHMSYLFNQHSRNTKFSRKMLINKAAERRAPDWNLPMKWNPTQLVPYHVTHIFVTHKKNLNPIFDSLSALTFSIDLLTRHPQDAKALFSFGRVFVASASVNWSAFVLQLTHTNVTEGPRHIYQSLLANTVKPTLAHTSETHISASVFQTRLKIILQTISGFVNKATFNSLCVTPWCDSILNDASFISTSVHSLKLQR